jgi:hypothetical protein
MDPSIIGLYERNFQVTLPSDFSSFLLAANGAVIDSVFVHPDLEPDENEFFVWRAVSIGRHGLNEPDDLLVLTEYEHYNLRTIPRKVIAFAFDYREWPIYLDLNDGGSGRVVVHDDTDRLPRPQWADLRHAYPCAYVADCFEDYVARLVPDPNPPH